MQILQVNSLAIPEIKVIKFARFKDNRGFFSEIYRRSDFENSADMHFLRGSHFIQINVSYSHPNTIRGMHFQWDPYMDKLVRVISGHMIDLVLDIRKNSPTFGKMIGYEMISNVSDDQSEWIWIPKGFAHGSVYVKETFIEYMCTAEWSPKTEASISPIAEDIDWSLCNQNYLEAFKTMKSNSNVLISDKDRDGFTLKSWLENPLSDKFTY